MKSTTLSAEFSPAVRKFAEEHETPESATQGGPGDVFREFHASIHGFLDEVQKHLGAFLKSPLAHEQATPDARSGLPVYRYWFVDGDQVFMQIDTRDPAIVRGSMTIVVSSEKDTTPERVMAMRDLAQRPTWSNYVHTGRRNTRWSFLYVTVPTGNATAAKVAAERIAPVLDELHRLDHVDFPRTYSGRFR
jgi:hypothetical protein